MNLMYPLSCPNIYATVLQSVNEIHIKNNMSVNSRGGGGGGGDMINEPDHMILYLRQMLFKYACQAVWGGGGGGGCKWGIN